MADDVLSLNQVANTGTLQSATNDGQGQTDLLANREDGARVIALERQEAPLQREEEHPAEKTEQTLTAIDSSMLKDDQYRAYDIITWHLEQVLAGAKPPLLRQILHGEGGTGKSKVIQTVTQHSPARCKIHAYQSSLHGNSSLDHRRKNHPHDRNDKSTQPPQSTQRRVQTETAGILERICVPDHR